MPDAAFEGPPGLSVVAGALGGAGYADDTGTAARFANPDGIALDAAGNLYIADSNNNAIRKMGVASGVVTTLAGTAGTYGSSDGTGAAASFGFPRGIALDTANNLYIADNNTIRKLVTGTGVVTTLAGKAGMAGSTDATGATARFNLPAGVAFDGTSNLYVADANNHTIRKVVVATGAVTTLAGTAGTSGTADGTGAAARFSLPGGLVLDGAGSLYVADTNNHAIRKVVVATGVVTTLAGAKGMFGNLDGTGTAARFNQPMGVALDGTSLYVTDMGNNTIRQIVVGTGAVSTLVGTAGVSGSSDGIGGGARFNGPQRIAVDGAGSLYVTDQNNQLIRKIAVATATVTTLSGAADILGAVDGVGGAARFNMPQSVAADGAGNLYVADTSNSTIRKVVLGTGAVTTLAGTAGVTGSSDGVGPAARFYLPYGIALDGSKSLYVADTNNHTIRKIDLATAAVTTVAGMPGGIGYGDGTGAAARFFFPFGITVDGAGTVYVADRSNHAIRKISPTGVVTTLAGAGGVYGTNNGIGSNARFSSPLGVAWDGAGSLYVSDSGNFTIRKVETNTGVVTTVAGTAGVSGSLDGTGAAARFLRPYGVAVDGMGSLLVADFDGNTVRKIKLADASVTTVIGTSGVRRVMPGPLPAQLNRPSGLSVSPSGVIFLLGENAVLSAR